MKRVIFSLVVLSGVGLMSAGPGRAAGGDDSAVQQSLMQMEREWADGMMKNDPTVIDRIEADDYAYCMDSFKGGKQGDVAEAKKHAYAGTAELTGMQVRVFENAAIVTGKAGLRNAKYNGKDVSGDYLFTDIFVNRNGRWQVVASHSNRVQPGM
jgi:hypothetical protein